MAWYLCELEGSNFAFKDERYPDGVALMGFYANRIVEAASPAEAEIAAINLIRDDSSMIMTVVKLETGPHPMIKANGVYELPQAPAEAPGAGYEFFPMPTATVDTMH